MRNEFNIILTCEANEEWRKGKDKNSKKKDHLEARHKPRKENGMVEDIPVGDEELGEDVERVEILAYEVELNDNEKEYLKLPNSVTDFEKIDIEKMKTGIQVMASKLRMSVNAVEETPESDLVDKEEEMASRRVYDEERRSADFRKKRVTDSALNKRITVPDPVAESKEVKIEALANMLDNIVDREAGKEERLCHLAGRPATTSTLSQLHRVC